MFFLSSEIASAQTGVRILGVDHVGVNVPDMKQAVTFFHDVLGFTPVTQLGPIALDAAWKEINTIDRGTGDVTIRMIHAGTGASIEVFQYANSKGSSMQPHSDDVGATHIAFYTEDIAAAVAYLKGKGVTLLGEPFLMPSGDTAGESWVYFLTPWGSKLELVSYPEGKGYEKSKPSVTLWSPKKVSSNAEGVSDPSANKTLAEQHLTLWNESDKSTRDKLMRQIYSSDIEMVDRHFTAVGYDAVDTFIVDLQRKNPDFKFAARSVEAHHNLIRLYWQVGSKAKPAVVTGMDLFVIANGKVEKLYVFVDPTK